ncbi:platelet endothelial cell adhesion molecule isoform X1 [Nelusetta ayraudi]|uniref:platelet endothelial cell adhesion molecule isoform X1 n=1 Tax=Nelusetta ayraudi TaxID=303726 RepID=UPI003F6F839A
MESRPPSVSPPPLLLLLASTLLLYPRPCVGEQSWYTIDDVSLTVLPKSTVETGTPVTFRCQVLVSRNDDLNLTHTFVFIRNDMEVNTTTTTDSTVDYQLNPARAADSGVYECRFIVKEKRKTSLAKGFEVTGLETPVLDLNNTGPYENEEFTARCSAPQEKGQLIFGFYQKLRTGNVEKLKQLGPTRNSWETTLVLRVVGDSLLYCDYEVNLVSGSRRSNRSAEIQVIVKELHIAPVMNVQGPEDIYEGDILDVVCEVVHRLNNIEVSLIKGREILKQARKSLRHQFRVQEGDSGGLVCKAEWGNVYKESYQAITVRELFSKPRLSLEREDVFEGDHFKLSCNVTVYVPDRIAANTLRYSIYKDNIEVTRSDSFASMAQPSKNGNYTCKVQAPSGLSSLVKESPTLVVKAKVPVSKPVLSVVGNTLVLGKPFQLRCHSNRGTLPIVYTLFGPNRHTARETVTTPEERAVFNVSAIHSSASIKNFLCRANNSQRRVDETGQVLRSTIIEPVSKPALHFRPMMGDVAEGQEVTLVCSVQGGSLPVSFTWYSAKKANSLDSVTVNKLEASHKITEVRRDHQGGYYCVSNNAANEAKQSPTVTIAVKMAGWKKGLIAVFCILLILALILVVVFKRRLLHFKKKSGAELSVKSAGTKVERLSLTQAEANEPANATPGMMGKSIWSEHVSGSESEDQRSVTSPEKAEPQYTEVQTKRADPNRAPVKKGTDTVYSEVRHSTQGVPEPPELQGSVEYAQLNHDADHHGDHGVPDDEAAGTTTDGGADQRECEHDQAPDCD